ncbi:MAG: type IV pilus secretin PilQ [Methylophaga sp.]|nr:type IV pilus secretin PilQ [Methylophaga sp.]
MKKALNIILTSWLMIFGINAFATDLKSLGYSSLPGEKAQLVLTFSESVGDPNSFSIDDPARIVLDFAGVSNKLDKKTQQINVGATRSVSTVESGDRTRMVINLSQKVPYTIEHDGNVIIVTIDGGAKQKSVARNTNYQVENIDFRRGETGEARLSIELNKPGALVDVHQERDTIVVDLMGVSLPEELHRRLDVIDFGTPVQMIDSVQKGQNTRLVLSATGKFDHLAYQADNKLVIEVRPIIEEITATGREKFGYSGEKLSLNFQQIEVRAVLQLLADFTGMNLVTSDTVQGNLTLRLKNVPWDQALDIILKTKGLAMRQNGNVMLIAPASEIAAREKQELAAKNQLIQLEPLYSEIIEVNFAKASELATLLQSGPEQSSSGAGVAGFLSSRGSVTVDQRTNSLLLRDTADQLVQIRKLIDRLDVAIRQVLIESRIVIATNDFTKELGVRFGVSSANHNGNGLLNQQIISGTLNGTDQINNGDDLEQNDRLNVDLGLANPAGTFALALAKLPFGTLLELELQALQAEGKGEVISSPRVITSNQSTAIIEQGTEIPYQQASSSGATAVSFKKAVLKLEVTPQITPDDKIIMDLKVNKDQAVFDARFTVPSIDTKKVETQVLVDNGETVVLGGVYEQTKSKSSSRVPFFGDLPYVGFLFKTTKNVDNKQELLIFVTPKIIKDSLKL